MLYISCENTVENHIHMRRMRIALGKCNKIFEIFCSNKKLAATLVVVACASSTIIIDRQSYSYFFV